MTTIDLQHPGQATIRVRKWRSFRLNIAQAPITNATYRLELYQDDRSSLKIYDSTSGVAIGIDKVIITDYETDIARGCYTYQFLSVIGNDKKVILEGNFVVM